MKYINDFSEYKQLLQSCKEKQKKSKSNCFLVAGTVERYIHEHRLLYEEDKGGLILYVDEGRYFTGYYIWDTECCFPDRWDNSAKPICIEELDVKDRRSEDIRIVEKEFIKRGFQARSVNHEIVIDLSLHGAALQQKLESGLALLAEKELKLEYCREQYVEQVTELWESSLAVTDLPYDHLHFMEHKEDRVLCIINNKAEVCCATWWRDGKASREGRHITTNPKYYRQGLGGY